MLHADESVISKATQLIEDVPVVDLPRSRLETPGHVRNFDILDQPFFHPFSQIQSQVALGLLEVVDIEIQLNMRVIHLAQDLEPLLCRQDRHAGMTDATERLQGQVDARFPSDVTRFSQTGNDLLVLSFPRDRLPALSDETYQISGAQHLGAMDYLGEEIKIRLLMSGRS